MARSRPDASSHGPTRIREAEQGDCGDLAGIYNEAIRSGRATMDTEAVSADFFATRLAGLSPREALLVVERAAGGVAGWGMVKGYSDRPGYAIACETSVYVAEDAQEQGAGSRLLDALVERAAQHGYLHLVAKIMAVNERSVDFHRQRGFHLVGRQRRIGRLSGVFHDVVILERLLSEQEPRSGQQERVVPGDPP